MLSNAVKEQFASTRPVCHTLKVSPWSLKFVDSQKMKFQILLPNRSRERCSGAFCFKFTRSQDIFQALLDHRLMSHFSHRVYDVQNAADVAVN